MPIKTTETPILSSVIGEEFFAVVQDDPVLFVKVFGGHEPYPFQAEAMRQVVARGPDARFSKPVWVISWPRQNGKSTTSAGLGVYSLFAQDLRLIVTVALDRESARIIFDAAKQMIENNPTLMSLIDDQWGLTRNEIRLKDGRRWIIKSADARMSRGLSPDIVLYDELGWTADSGALFEVLSAAQAAQPNPLTVVTSTVAPVKYGPLWDLFQAAERGDADVGLIYSQENLSPRITPEFLKRQEVLLPPTVFAREHKNEWVEGSDLFATEADWEVASSRGDPSKAQSEGPTFAFLDLSWVHDESVLAIVEPTSEEEFDLIHFETWRGSQKKPIKLPLVRDRVADLARIYGIRHLVVESPQGVAMAQELDKVPYLKAEFLTPTRKSNNERYGFLYQLLKKGFVRLPEDEALRRQLLTLTIQQVAGGESYKIVDQPDVHNDRAVALAGALFLAESKSKSRAGGLFLPEGMYGPIVTAKGENVDQKIRQSKEGKRKLRKHWGAERTSDFMTQEIRSRLKNANPAWWARIRSVIEQGDLPNHRIRIQFKLAQPELEILKRYPTKESWMAEKWLP